MNLYHDEHDLLARVCQHDDYQAFEVLFHRYQPSLRLYALKLSSSEILAEEIVSDVFIKIWKSRQQLELRGSLRSYLFTAIRNQSLDYLRRRQRDRMVQPTCSFPDNACEDASPEDMIIYHETLEKVEAAISALPPQGQYIFRLSRDEGLKYREIAERLNLSIKTVETHMRRSLIFLRRELQVAVPA
ncbi:MAG: RNA polymerase sigma-70 factor [Bacteroidetes bacterium]|nr:MAG: RNA polymerase sigma-70 factor [Bacteroidota bacterium]